jgi:hypothetical protein
MSWKRYPWLTVGFGMVMAALLVAGATGVAQSPAGEGAPPGEGGLPGGAKPGPTTTPYPEVSLPEGLRAPGGEEPEEGAGTNDGEEFFKRIAGSSLLPRSSSMGYEYGESGCIWQSIDYPGGYFTVDLQLPQGALVNGFRVYFKDNSQAFNAHAWIYAYDGQGGSSELAHISSDGTPGYGSAGQVVDDYEVNNKGESLAIVAGLEGATDDSLMLCGVRVRYEIPFSQVHLPSILNDAHP